MVAEFFSFDAIVEKEGGSRNPANIEAARKRCRKCIEKGAKYAKYDTWSERAKYAFIVEGFSATRPNAYQQQSTGTTVPGAPTGSAADAGASGIIADATPILGKQPPRTPRDRTSLEKNLSAATSTKTAYKGIVGDAEGLLEQMGSDADYKREKLAYSEDLQASLASLKKMKDGTPFIKKFVVMEISDVRKEHPTPDVLSASCVHMTKTMNPSIAVTGKLVTRAR